MSQLNITDAIFAQAAARPDAVAVIDGERMIDYRTLCRGVLRAAAQFAQAGWAPGDIVGISLRGGPLAHLIASLALARIGVAQVALPPADWPALCLARTRRLGVRAVIADHDAAAAAGVAAVAPVPGWLAQGGASVPDTRVDGGTHCWLVSETSGTTGVPKPIAISQDVEDAQHSRQLSVFAHRVGERFVSLTGLQFSVGIKRALWCLREGATLALPPQGLSTPQLLEWLDEKEIRYLACVPVHLHNLLEAVAVDRPRLPRLRILRCGSAELTAALRERVQRRLSPNLYIGYGLGEAGAVCAATPEMVAAHPATVGRPFDGVELQIVDGDDQPLSAGRVGRVRVRGPGIEASREALAFRAGWCYSGDVGTLDEQGLLYLEGRTDDLMNYDGIMVAPAEIEAALAQHPAILEAAAFALPSAEHQHLPAVAFRSARPLALEELERFCGERLGARTPRVFLQVEAMPRNPMGKVLRRELAAIAQAQLAQRRR